MAKLPELTEKQPEEVVKKDSENLLKEKEDRIKALEAELEKRNKMAKYAPTVAPMPKEQQGLPEGMQESQIKTTIRDMSSVIKEKMMQLHDLATAEVLLDVFVRARNRLESIKKMTSAEHIKVRGQWKTVSPQMHVAGLVSKKISNDEYEINFGVFETDEKGNKRLYTHYADFYLPDGKMIRRPTSAEYRIAYEVVEKIYTGKPITREVIRLDIAKGETKNE